MKSLESLMALQAESIFNHSDSNVLLFQRSQTILCIAFIRVFLPGRMRYLKVTLHYAKLNMTQGQRGGTIALYAHYLLFSSHFPR